MATAVNGHASNGHANGHANGHHLLSRLIELDRSFFERKAQSKEAESIYASGESSRMNPVPRGINPFGTDADYHYRTEFNYFLHVERARAAVRNHPLVEQGIRRLIANLRLGEETLDVDSGDETVDADHQQWFADWAADAKQCDYEQTRNFSQIAQQSFFSQIVDGDIAHLPLREGSLQTWESHHIRTPWGHRPTNSDRNGIIHGAEVRDGKTVAYWITPTHLSFSQIVPRSGQAKRFPVFDADGNKITFWLGFTHRFAQRRGISRLSAPRDAMTGFDDLNYAHIKSALRRALISYLMEQSQIAGPGANVAGDTAALPQAGDRYTRNDIGLGLQGIVIEQLGEPAQAFKAPPGYTLKGWNANLPGAGFFEQSALLLTMLSVNLDLPLMFLLLDGSLVNFHGGRMTFDQAKLRFKQLQKDQISGLYGPTYEWKTRQRMTPGSVCYDPAFARAVAAGANPFKYTFRPHGWPYVKPLEDAAGEDLSERRNLRSLKAILADRGIDEDEHRKDVIQGRVKWARDAITEAIAIAKEFPEAKLDVGEFFRELWYGNDATGVKYAINADGGAQAETPPRRASRDNAPPAQGGSDA
jgi:hypothetical protein